MSIYRNKIFQKELVFKSGIVLSIAVMISVIILLISLPYVPLPVAIILFIIPLIYPLYYRLKCLYSIPRYVEINGNELHIHSKRNDIRIKKSEVERYSFSNGEIRIDYKRDGSANIYEEKKIDDEMDGIIRKEFLKES